MAFAFAVLWGVLFPTDLRDACAATEIAVSTPYYDFFAVAFGLPLLLLAGIGPVVAWRRASLAGVARAFRWSFLSAASAAALLVRARLRRRACLGVVALSLCLFVAVTIVLELARGTRARRALDARRCLAARVRAPDRPQPAPLRRLHRAPGRGRGA